MKYKFVILLLMALFSLSSCYTIRYTYSGNIHQQCIGKSKTEVLRTYGVPDRIQDDGAGGSILVYELQPTSSTAKTASNSRSSKVGTDIYTVGGITAASDIQVVQVSSMKEKGQTSMNEKGQASNKRFCMIYVNAKNVVYDFKSNYGALYKTSKHYHKALTWVTVVGSCALIFLHQFLLANSQ